MLIKSGDVGPSYLLSTRSSCLKYNVTRSSLSIIPSSVRGTRHTRWVARPVAVIRADDRQTDGMSTYTGARIHFPFERVVREYGTFSNRARGSYTFLTVVDTYVFANHNSPYL